MFVVLLLSLPFLENALLSLLFRDKIVSMIRKYHNHKLQTTPWHHEEEPLISCLSCFLFCSLQPCCHLLGKADLLTLCMWCFIVFLSLFHVVSWVRYGTWLYWFLILCVIDSTFWKIYKHVHCKTVMDFHSNLLSLYVCKCKHIFLALKTNIT